MLVDLDRGRDVELRGALEDISWGMTFSADSARLVTTADDGSATVWSTATGEAQLRLTTTGLTPAVTFSPDGTMLVTGSVDHQVRVWDLDNGVELASYTAPDEVYGLRWSPDGVRLAVGTLTAAVVWHAPSATTDLRILDALVRRVPQTPAAARAP
jgi:WD40 repeat protein